MAKIFISHASDDRYFVDLLAKLLEFHYIETWYCYSDIEPGCKYRNEIDEGIDQADSLIVVVSDNSLKSKWVTREIAIFQAKRPDAKIIPLLLGPMVNPDDVFDGLKEYQSINFNENMLAGFEKLFVLFDKEFLPQAERRDGTDRRTDDRRNGADRRASDMRQRFRIGFWKCYSAASGASKFDDFSLTVHNRMKVMDILESEIRKYEYFDKEGNRFEIEARELDKLTYEVWEDMSGRGYLTAIIAIEAIAEKISQKYIIKQIDRRKKDRRSDVGRRKTD